MNNADIVSKAGKWEYAGYAVWDLAFQVHARNMVNVDFAKGQLDLSSAKAMETMKSRKLRSSKMKDETVIVRTALRMPRAGGRITAVPGT